MSFLFLLYSQCLAQYLAHSSYSVKTHGVKECVNKSNGLRAQVSNQQIASPIYPQCLTVSIVLTSDRTPRKRPNSQKEFKFPSSPLGKGLQGTDFLKSEEAHSHLNVRIGSDPPLFLAWLLPPLQTGLQGASVPLVHHTAHAYLSTQLLLKNTCVFV